MNQYFNPIRFGRLLRKHTAEHLASYCLNASVLLGGLLAVLGFVSYVSSRSGGLVPGEQSAVLMLALLGAGTFFASTVLAEYGQGSRAALALMLPASQFEKYAGAWLVSVPGFLMVFTAAFYLADWLVLTLSNDPNHMFNVFKDGAVLRQLLVYFLLLHAVALWGSIFFRRQQFVRTGFLVFALVVLLSLLNYQALGVLLGTKLHFSLPLGDVRLDQGARLSLPHSQERWLSWLPVALVLLLWPAAYARLTEQQL